MNTLFKRPETKWQKHTRTLTTPLRVFVNSDVYAQLMRLRRYQYKQSRVLARP